jgi:hypothetical protein
MSVKRAQPRPECIAIAIAIWTRMTRTPAPIKIATAAVATSALVARASSGNCRSTIENMASCRSPK